MGRERPIDLRSSLSHPARHVHEPSHAPRFGDRVARKDEHKIRRVEPDHSRSSEGDAIAARERLQLRQCGMCEVWRDRRKHDKARPKTIRGLVDGVPSGCRSRSRRCASRKNATPARTRSDPARASHREGRPTEPLAQSPDPSPCQAEQSTPQDAGQKCPRPPFASPRSQRSPSSSDTEDHVGQNRLDGCFGEESIERRLSSRLVEGIEGGGEFVACRRRQAGRWRDAIVGGATG